MQKFWRQQHEWSLIYVNRHTSQVAKLAFSQLIIVTISPQQFPKAFGKKSELKASHHSRRSKRYTPTNRILFRFVFTQNEQVLPIHSDVRLVCSLKGQVTLL